ncbi:MAG TPA: DUF2917 domain-containing protein [Fimbriimonadaceae bacterium]|nr:DUF2917 domain-containing protein [Fimbriimonadaceae bacterium]
MKDRQHLTIVGNGGSSVELRRGSLISFGPGRVDIQIEVCKGDLWITDEGTLGDKVLHAGEHEALAGKHVVAEALSDSLIRVA